MAAVGFVTYLVVFNLSSVAKLLGDLYARRKQQIVVQMKSNDAWQDVGRRFEAFAPQHHAAQREPSQWYIIWFWAAGILRLRQKKRTRDDRKKKVASQGQPVTQASIEVA